MSFRTVRAASSPARSGRGVTQPTGRPIWGAIILQISVLQEGVERTFMGWFAPGRRTFSQSNVMLSSLFRYRREEFGLTTGLNGSLRAMVPFGNFEDIMPLDILPTQLLRYLVVGDTDMAQQAGLHGTGRGRPRLVLLRVRRQERLRPGATERAEPD